MLASLRRSRLARPVVTTALLFVASVAAAQPMDGGTRLESGPALPLRPHPELSDMRPAEGGPRDFWIVSSRRCPQAGTGRPIPCRLDYFHSRDGRCVAPVPRTQFEQSIDPRLPMVVIVHGSFTGWEAVVRDSGALVRWLRRGAIGRPLQVVVYDWPSDSPTGFLFGLDVSVLGRRSGFNGIYLAQFAAALPPEQPVCFVGHSHGARTVAAALHLLGGGEVRGYRMLRPRADTRRYRAVLLAAALDHHWLIPGERYGDALCRVDFLLNLRNETDFALNAYPLRRPFSNRALGEAGFTARDRLLLGPLQSRIAEISVASSVGTGHVWSHYLRRPELAASIVDVARFQDALPAPIGIRPRRKVSNTSRRPVEPPARPVESTSSSDGADALRRVW